MDNDNQSFYNPNETGSKINTDSGDNINKPNETIHWIDSEDIQRKKVSWYLVFIAIFVVISGLFYLITKDYITSIVILVCCLLLVFYTYRKPKSIEYFLSDHVLKIASREYLLGDFKYFSVIESNNRKSIVLVPIKRLIPSIYLYLNTEQAQKIIDIIGKILPNEKYTPDLGERLMSLIGL